MTMIKRSLEEEPDNIESKKLKPRATYPCILGRDRVTGKFIFPTITKDDVMNARLFLKNNDLKTFLEFFLPIEVNSIYIYFMIKLLGFDVKDKELFMALNSNITSNKERNNSTVASSMHAEFGDDGDDVELTDPLEKKHAVKLIKDLQKAINKVLSTRLRLPNFNTIDHLIATLHNSKKILVLTGAGVSTSLGIPDFRSSEGFYSKIRHLGLEDPQDVFNLDIFLQDPSVFYNIAHMVLPPENMYSPLHSFIKMLQDKGKLLRNYTQNIDNLESYAGIDPDKLVQCHGSFATASCVTCHWQIPGEKIFDNIRNLELPLCPYCYQKRKQYFPTTNDNNTMQTNTNFNSPILKSYGVLKPDMTFFGEALPSRFHKTIRKDILECDLLICIGTSLKVAPVSEIVNMVPSHVPQILINRDMVVHAEFDLNLLGFCDDVASHVAKKCHWDIPHKKWEDLKKIDCNCTEIDKGTYEITKQSRKNKK